MYRPKQIVVFLSFILGLILFFVLGLIALNYYRLSEINTLKQEKESLISKSRQQALELSNKLREAEAALAVSYDKAKKDTDAQTLIFNKQRDTLLKRLQLAEARANSNLPQTTPTPGATETPSRNDLGELPNTIGEEDVQEAERADIIRTNLLLCYASYDRAKETIEQLHRNTQ